MHRLGARRWRLVVAVVLVAASGVVLAPNRSHAQLDSCHITEAHATLFTAFNEGGVVAYYGHGLMSTEGCGHGPVSMEVTFRPMFGQPQTCTPISSAFVHEAACTYAYGSTIQGTHVFVTGTGHAAGGDVDGSGGEDEFNSTCILIVPTMGRASCPFPLE